MLSSFTQYYWITLSRIVQNSSLLAKKPGPCLSPSVAGRPLRPATDRRLGRLLPHQLPNLAQAHPKTTVCLYELFDISNFKIYFKTKLSQILGQILVYYSPVRHVFTFD